MSEPEGDPPPIDLDAVLRNALAPWQRDGAGIRGSQPTVIAKQPDPPPEGRWPLKIDKQEESQPFPTPPAETPVVDPAEEGSAGNESYSFQLLLDSIDQVGATVRILVLDGEINDAFPTGMTGADDYFLTLTTGGTEIWGVIVYDPDTQVISSRTLDFGAAVPDSILGTLYVPIGFVDWEVVAGKIVNVVPRNRLCGDINVAFVYGAMNGARALIPVRIYADWVAVP